MLGAIGGGAFVLVSLLVGIRLVLIGRRTRQFQELAMGLGLFCVAGLGYPLMVLARFGTFMPDSGRLTCLVLYQLMQIFGITAVATFNWRVFRPDEKWARNLVVAVGLAMTACFVGQIVHPGLLAWAHDAEGIWNHSSPITVIPLAWAGIESFRYYGLMKKRLALGMASPQLSERFAFWGTASLFASCMSIYSYGSLLMGVDVNTRPEGPVILGILGFVAATSLWLAFLAPQWYCRWRGFSDSRAH